MPTPTLVLGAPCWIDLYSSDAERAIDFYGRLFGWTHQPGPPEFGGYFTFSKDGKTVAGCMPNDGQQGYPDAWTVHLLTDDAERTAASARAQGGQVHFEPMKVADNGVSTMIGDRMSPATVANSSHRNSSHSVSTTRTSAPSQGP